MTMTNGDVEEQRQKKKFFVCGGPARRICWHILEKQFSKMPTHPHREREGERDSYYYNTHSPIHAKVQSSTHDCENGIAKVAHDEGELKSCTIFSFFFLSHFFFLFLLLLFAIYFSSIFFLLCILFFRFIFICHLAKILFSP